MEENGGWAHEQVVRFLARASGRPPESIRLDMPLAHLDIDSLEEIEFIMEIEDEFGFDIPNPIAPLVTVGDLVDFVRSAKR